MISQTGSNMHQGYVKLYRKSIDNEMMKNHKLWVFWTWCLMKASHKRKKIFVGYQEIILEPGQLVFGRKTAAINLRMSERSIRTCLQILKKAKNLTIKSTNKFSIITIINWDRYQSDYFKNDQQNDKRATSKRPASDQQTTTNKNDKNVKNEKKKTLSLIFFQNFIKNYPKQKSIGEAEKIFMGINPDEKLFFEIMNGLETAKKSEEWKKESGRYIPHPGKWLESKGWKDKYNIQKEIRYYDTQIPYILRFNDGIEIFKNKGKKAFLDYASKNELLDSDISGILEMTN